MGPTGAHGSHGAHGPRNDYYCPWDGSKASGRCSWVRFGLGSWLGRRPAGAVCRAAGPLRTRVPWRSAVVYFPLGPAVFIFHSVPWGLDRHDMGDTTSPGPRGGRVAHVVSIQTPRDRVENKHRGTEWKINHRGAPRNPSPQGPSRPAHRPRGPPAQPRPKAEAHPRTTPTCLGSVPGAVIVISGPMGPVGPMGPRGTHGGPLGPMGP